MKNNSNTISSNNASNYSSDIAAKIHISESELELAYNDYSYEDFYSNPTKYYSTMQALGMNVKEGITFQPTCLHRNRLNKAVICGRYYGNERTDPEWLKSPFASQAAKDKAANCRLIDEIYQQRGLTQTAQIAGELKDAYQKKDAGAVEGLLELCKNYDEDEEYKESKEN